MSGYTITVTDREYDAMKERIRALEAALRTITSNGLTDLEMLDVANAALAQSETKGEDR